MMRQLTFLSDNNMKGVMIWTLLTLFIMRSLVKLVC